jgi:hypothetical protein
VAVFSSIWFLGTAHLICDQGVQCLSRGNLFLEGFEAGIIFSDQAESTSRTSGGEVRGDENLHGLGGGRFVGGAFGELRRLFGVLDSVRRRFFEERGIEDGRRGRNGFSSGARRVVMLGFAAS